MDKILEDKPRENHALLLYYNTARMYKIILLTLLLLPLTYLGDTVLFKCQILIVKAVVDNITHGLIGLITWYIVYLRSSKSCCIFGHSSYEMLLSYFMASAIDVDHFLMAGSINLNAATKLGDRRPILHCTTLWLAIVSSLILTAQVLENGLILRFAWLVFATVISHHLRDGTRRGLWLAPFGSTRPIPYTLYLFLLVSLPHVTTELLDYSHHILLPSPTNQRIIDV